jgi:phosphatidylinositol alpha-1,6-mannosyltransferase
MKLLLLTLDFPPETGGIQTLLYELCQNFHKFEPIVIAPKKGEEEKFDVSQSFKIYRVGLFSCSSSRIAKLLFLLLMLIKAFTILIRQRIDVVLCGHVTVGIVGLTLKRLHSKPYVIYTYAMELVNKSSLTTLVLQKADRVIVISEYTKKLVACFGVPISRITKINPGIDYKIKGDLDVGAFKKSYGLTGKKILLSVSRLQELYKGHDYVIKSLPLIKAKVPEAHYVIVGEGWLKSYYQKLAENLGIIDDISFAGRVPDKELRKWYQICDVFVMVSRDSTIDGGTEGFGIVYLEANAYGKPVVGGRAGGVTDAIIDNVIGLLVNPENKIEITEAIVKLLANPELAKKLGQQGRKRVLQNLSWEKVGEKVEKVLLSTVGKDVALC